MKKISILFASFIFLLTTYVFGQDETKNFPSLQKNIIKWAPLNLLDFINPSFELGYERALNKKYSIQVSGAFLVPIHWLPSSGTETTGGRLRIEGRKYLAKSEKIIQGVYLASDICFLYNEHYSVLDFAEYSDDDLTPINIFKDTVKVQKRTFNVNLKIGYQKTFNRLVLDAYLGLGLKYRAVRQLNKINSSEQIKVINTNFVSTSDIEDSYLTMNFPLNIKIGYSF